MAERASIGFAVRRPRMLSLSVDLWGVEIVLVPMWHSHGSRAAASPTTVVRILFQNRMLLISNHYCRTKSSRLELEIVLQQKIHQIQPRLC